MKFSQFRFLIPVFAILFLNSCLGTTDPITYSEDPTFVSLHFAKNDSIANLDTASFSLEFDLLLNDSVIVNLDSLPFNTRIDSVYPTFSFKSSGGTLLYFQNDDSVGLSGTDTIDFTQVKSIKNTAADLIHTRTYPIKVNVHQVEPNLYVWNKVSDNLTSDLITSQKAIYFNDSAFYFINNGVNNYRYSSNNGYAWGNSETVSGLPATCSFSDLSAFGNKLYVTNGDNSIYSSVDGKLWLGKQLTDYTFKHLLFTLNNKLWAVVKSNVNDKNYFANSVDAINWEVNILEEIPANFPQNNFTTLAFYSRTGKNKGIVLGPDVSGKMHNWNTENGTYWIDFSLENNSLDSLAAGASVLAYDNKLFLFGVRNDSLKLTTHFKVSIDEGLSWQKPDTTYNVLNEAYSARNNISSIVFKPLVYDKTKTYLKSEMQGYNRIFLFGGNTNTGNFTDIWTGKVNRLSFLRQ